MRREFRLKHALACSAAVLLVAVIVGTSIYGTRQNLDDFAAMLHARETLLEVQRLKSAVQDVESGQRGFIITGTDSYLDPYRRGREDAAAHLEKVSTLARGDASIAAHAAALRRLIARKLGEIEDVVGVRRTGGFDASREIVESGVGKELMDQIRDEFAAMESELQVTMSSHQYSAIQSLKQTNNAIVVCGMIALAGGAVFSWMLFLYLGNQDKQHQLSVEKETAQKADRAKSEFLAMMSHEIRTPMNAILGFGELLHDSATTTREKKFTEAILTSGNSLLTLINDILDISKIEAGKMEIHSEPVRMDELERNLAVFFAFRASEKGLDYRVILDPSVPPVLVFDPLRVRQVLLNLIGNALKFTRVGSVAVKIGPFKPMGGKSRGILRFLVEDTGIGIPEDELESVFRPFFQIDSHDRREFQGTGLGLAISRRLTSMMGGSLNVASQVGKGSKFRLELPVQLADEGELEELPDAPAEVDFDRLIPSKILVADAGEFDREVIRGFLADSDHQIFEAERSEEVADICGCHRPDVILLDLWSPGLDGRAIRKKLKADPATRSIPLIAVSATPLLDDGSGLSALFEGALEKPINRAALLAQLGKILPARQTAPRKAARGDTLVDGGWRLERRTTAEWSDLLAALQGPLAREAERLAAVMPMQASLEFAKRLAARADDSTPPLAGFAAQLQGHLEAFETDAAAACLRRLPALADSLTTALSTHTAP
ncbi:CHASE3 domain-containing protein [Luteolibacter ambystomatis]|uniref:histidine kinase n=1 Tax=Luteolibacter ambystomatis TaxID=2824561 RepID=A0A975G7W8_9BACT|nr:CHASE3 domain-containing protein [Luteolibacter ambystomatis]QUE50967.1 CHASE3 domain-containing protein [Luteolibacter ambystomatis]